MDYDKAVDETAPDWGRWKHGSQADHHHQSPVREPGPAVQPHQSSAGAESPDPSPPVTQMQLTPNKNMDFLT